MKPQTKARMTKRERKATQPRNAMYHRSLGTAGVEHPLHKRSDGRIYTGSAPEYANINGAFVKVRPGVPFVRVK